MSLRVCILCYYPQASPADNAVTSWAWDSHGDMCLPGKHLFVSLNTYLSHALAQIAKTL
jgi:hypothetical protein